MLLKAITNGSVTSTGTVTCESGVIGGILITTDNTNQGTVILRMDGSGGKQVIEIKTVTSMWVSGPFWFEETDQVYHAVSGTNCEAQLYEWIT